MISLENPFFEIEIVPGEKIVCKISFMCVIFLWTTVL